MTFHSSDDTVLGWRPDSRAVLFSANRGEDFTPQLYLVSVEGGMPTKAGTDMGVQAAYSPDGRRLAYNPKSGLLAQVLSRRHSERRRGDGRGREAVYSVNRFRWTRFVADVGT
ncbi:MAG: hypothetical protein M3Q91_12480 [Acidobacteriota bacterium]|nr:hypothetical protein [Acidobacteriota bacterium]